MERLTVRQLEYLVAVADTGSFSAAARACFVSQPSLSAQVAAAEQVLGVQLFVRHARSVRPTAAGEVAVTRARAALRAVSAVGEAARWEGVLKVGAIETVGPYLFGPWLAALRGTHGAPTVRPSVGRTAELWQQLNQGSLDAVVLALPTPAQVPMTVLGEDPLYLAVAAGRGTAGPVGLDELSRHEMLLLEEGHCLRDQAIDVCTAAGVDEVYAPLPGATLGTLVEMVASDLGATLVPSLALGSLAGRTDVDVVPFAAGGPSRTLALCYLKASDELELAAGVARDVVSATA